MPVYWIAARDPEATVVVFPSDHFVLEGAAFVAHVAEVVAFVERQRDRVVLLGARATEPDTEYGWIEPGEAVGATTSGPISRVARFREKPKREAAAMCLAREWLWNTFVMVAKASTLVSVADVLLPELHRRLTAVTPLFGTRREAWAIRQAYESLPRRTSARRSCRPRCRSWRCRRCRRSPGRISEPHRHTGVRSCTNAHGGPLCELRRDGGIGVRAALAHSLLTAQLS